MDYRAKKIVADGVKFHSEKEYKFYLLLKKLGYEIYSFHPKFTVQEGFISKQRGEKVHPIRYDGDFWLLINGESIVIDVKGDAIHDKVFAIKRKLFEYKYPDVKLLVLSECPKIHSHLQHELFPGYIETDKLEAVRKLGRKAKKSKGAVTIDKTKKVKQTAARGTARAKR